MPRVARRLVKINDEVTGPARSIILSRIYQRVAAIGVVADHAELEQISRRLRVHQILQRLGQHQGYVSVVRLFVVEEPSVFVL